jgi:hypothetical protein
MYVDRESLLQKAQSELLIRPALYLNTNTPVPRFAKLLKKCVLRTTTTNDEGVTSSQLQPDFQLSEEQETVHRFTVPDNLRRIQFELELELRVASSGGTQTVSASVSYDLNSIEDTDRIDDLHLRFGTEGYSVLLLGKAGEPRPGVRLSFTFHHTHVTSPIRTDLQTDSTGRVLLGALPLVSRVEATAAHSNARGSWPIEQWFATPRTLYHASEGELLRIPYFGEAKAVRLLRCHLHFALCIHLPFPVCTVLGFLTLALSTLHCWRSVTVNTKPI